MNFLWKVIGLGMLAAIVLTGCMSLNEEIWVNADGSGRVRIVVATPVRASTSSVTPAADTPSTGSRRAVRRHSTTDSVSVSTVADTTSDIGARLERIGRKLDGDPNVVAVHVTSENRDGSRYHSLEIEVREMLSLPQTLERAASDEGDNPFRGISVSKLTPWSYEFRQVIDAAAMNASGAISPVGDGGSIGIGVVDLLGGILGASGSRTGGYAVVAVLHAPNISSSNGEITDGGATVTWRISASELAAMGGRRELVAQIGPPMTTWILWGGGACLALVVLGVVFLVLIIRKKGQSGAER